MAELPLMNDDLNIIQKLDNEPNDVAGLSAGELKAKFDEGGIALQNYINGVLIPGIEGLLAALNENKAEKEELQNVVLNQVPDGTITSRKIADGGVESFNLAPEAVTESKLSLGVATMIKNKAEQTALDDHKADIGNPHKVAANQVAISETLAQQLGMTTPAFVEEVLSDVGADLQELRGAVTGTPEMPRWKMYKWALIGTTDALTSGYNDPVFCIRTSESIKVAEDGTISLVNPTEVGETDDLPNVGLYFQCKEGDQWQSDTYRVLDTSSRSSVASSNPPYSTTYLYWEGLERQVSYESYLGMITDDDPDKYPEDGFVDGVHYIRETRLSTKIAQIQSGDYTGIGECGESNPTLLEFNFAPAVFAVFDAAGVLQQIFCANALATEYAQLDSSGVYAKKSEDGKIISLYHASDCAKQFNTLSGKYRFVGIG